MERPVADVYSSDRCHIYARESGRDSGFSVEIPYGFTFLMERGVEGRRRSEVPPPPRTVSTVGRKHAKSLGKGERGERETGTGAQSLGGAGG